MKYLILILLKIIFLFIKLSNNQSVPSIPCPNIFNYFRNSKTNEIEGFLSISDIKTGRENVVIVKMSYPPYVVNDNPGVIGLAKSEAATKNDIIQHQPVAYKIIFPTIDPVPKLQEVIFNGAIICRNQDYQSGDSEITLSYNLKVPNLPQIPSTYSGITNRDSIIQTPNINSFATSISEPLNFQTSQSDNTISCGNSIAPIRLIFGGSKFQKGSWPWLAAMFRRTSTGQFNYICSSSIIAPNAVLSAAHCVITENDVITQPHDIVIGLGIFDLNIWNEPNTFISNVRNIVPHPDYSKTNRYYDADIAIIILDRSYPYNERIRPICMWTGKSNVNDIVNEQGYVAGWGVAKVGGKTERLPNIIESEIVSHDTCLKSNIAFHELISNRNFCAGYRNGQGPCKGDSGSGFMIERGGNWYLRGVVSGSLTHVKTVCNLNEYAIYTDVAKFRKWIRSYVNY
ncbi:serine protease gd-like [Condylostylus longicornis]|uniref:serine protease gd-like n=1 Tax=Condylostylus longicornis TaxID=2530218 RepID=UPI00244DA286|nr:serine protease gd-like [Condylostylus longicornis]